MNRELAGMYNKQILKIMKGVRKNFNNHSDYKIVMDKLASVSKELSKIQIPKMEEKLNDNENLSN